MDKDKLNEAADIASNNAVYDSNPWNMFNDGFKQGANWLMQQPLTDRLTDEEKEKIRELYLTDEEIEGVKTAFGAYPVAAATITKNMLEQIFGKELFSNQPTEL